MKKNRFFLMLVLGIIVSLFSCKKEEIIDSNLSKPIVLLEDIDVWDLEYEDNLLYFITSGSVIASIDIINPTGGITEIVSNNTMSNISDISLYDGAIYIATSPSFKKYSLDNEDISVVSYFPDSNIDDMICYNGFVYYSFSHCSSSYCWGEIERFSVLDGDHLDIGYGQVWYTFDSFFISDNYLYMVSHYSELNELIIKRMDLNSIVSTELITESITVDVDFAIGNLFIKGSFIFAANENKIYKFNLANPPSGLVNTFEFDNISFDSVKLIGDELYFADHTNHTLSKIKIDFDK